MNPKFRPVDRPRLTGLQARSGQKGADRSSSGTTHESTPQTGPKAGIHRGTGRITAGLTLGAGPPAG
jgi:hypothetical protein